MHVLDLKLDAAATAVQQLNARHVKKGPCTAHACDVANEEAVELVLSKICTGGARLDILICNAGISAVGTVVATTEPDMDRVYDVNVKGVFYCLKYGVKRMLADGKGGAIVNLASIASLIGLADRFAYSMTKGAVFAMTRSVACDYVKKGIRSALPPRTLLSSLVGFAARTCGIV